MSASDTFNVMQSGDFRMLRWLEIEGLPWCYGTGPGNVGGSFFTPRASTAEEFEGIRSWIKLPPAIEDVELDVLDAFPKNSGALQVEIVDVDGSVTALVNTDPGSARLAADITDATTEIVYVGADPGFTTGGGTAYIGNETIKYTSHSSGVKTLYGCTRGRYRSVPREWGIGVPIHMQPYTMAKRRVWYFTLASSEPSTGSFFGFVDSAKWLRFAGTLESLRGNEGLTGYELKATTLEKDLDRSVFNELRQFEGPAEAKIRGLGGTEGLDTGATWSSPGVSLRLAEGECVAVRCDAELMGIQRVGVTEFLRLVRRGLMNTEIEEHSAGATMREVVLVCPGVSGAHTDIPPATGAEAYLSFFSSYGSAGTSAGGGGTWFPADHPLAIMLCVMLSGSKLATNDTDGNGFVTPGRSFDLGASFELEALPPAAWFLGIDATRLDLNQIVRLANETAWLRVSGVIEDSVNFITWAKTLLQPFGFYVTYTADGLFTVKPLRPPLPGSTLRALTDNDRIQTARPSYDANLSSVVSRVEYRYGWDIAESRFRRIVVLQVNEGELYSAGRGRTLVYESKLLYTGRERIPGELSRDVGFNVQELLRQRGDFYQARFARPPAIIVETVKLDLIDVALGDLIALTSTNSPSANGGGRGLDEAICEVIGRRVDEVEKTIEITLLLTGFSTGDYRCIGPSAVISGVSASGGNTDVALYVDPPGLELNGRGGWYDYTRDPAASDGQPTEGLIGGNQITYFPPGAAVRVFTNNGDTTNPKWDWSTSPGSGFLVLSSTSYPPVVQISGAHTFNDGDLLVYDGWTTNPGAGPLNGIVCGSRPAPAGLTDLTIGRIFAFLADSAGLLGGTDPGHKFFPA